MHNKNKITFLSFSPDLSETFAAINKEWISTMFELEQTDLDALTNPQHHIIDPGGKIYFAKHDELGVVGCCALLPKSDGVFELTKMGVSSRARGNKIGEPLLAYTLQQAKTLPIKRLFLLTNKKCEAAIHLYEKHGFEHDQEVMDLYGKSYQRCDVAMKYPAIWSL
ncbi:GNAT family N-acetyltransferase [Neptunicella marina]|uniref:GNAT family N-acetyltransferase n=1 Tax=Neptunicella marina TaxID=2125989 RepID=UPI001F50DA02|nr:GNAT family N-acetyltransferase [Neptunicella marina]